MKTCQECTLALPDDSYAVCKSSPDNLFMICIDCVHKWWSAYEDKVTRLKTERSPAIPEAMNPGVGRGNGRLAPPLTDEEIAHYRSVLGITKVGKRG
jgi:hypothetical protein